ncbi:MAG: aminoacyl-tRNA hydrolase [Bacilli bacterium]|nr:aminoacyl-tRNA hydrolase [Bacilli bacterium]
MKLIVGLGNPGLEYENTRHNIGYIFIDNFAKSYNIEINKKKFNGLYNELLLENEKIILLKPLSYMNLSGEVVEKFVHFFKISIDDVLVINDDLDLSIGKIRLRKNGSSGGHNGLKNIALHLNSDNFKRLKIGISNNKNIDTKDYVLGKFNKEELEIINAKKEIVNNLLDEYIKGKDIEKLMCKYNTEKK